MCGSFACEREGKWEETPFRMPQRSRGEAAKDRGLGTTPDQAEGRGDCEGSETGEDRRPPNPSGSSFLPTAKRFSSIILWLTGHTAKSLQKAIDAEIDIETFYAKAPRFQPNASLIKGVVCGVRVEEIEDETMRKIRYLDKLIDELAKGKAKEKILRK
jgi:hypothetical protein